MKNFWIQLIKPKGFIAKWLLLIVLGGIAYLWSQGQFAVAEKYLDTEQLTITIGTYKITLYAALKALLSVVIIFWVTAIISDFSDKRINAMKKMRIANKALFQKLAQIIIYIIAFLLTLNILGINLTSLTILSGAIGIGLGFGMQKIAANFVSGLILTLERSLKPGDLIELEDGTFGYVRKSSSRATLIETIDGKEIIVPNEEFITKQVVNWTLNNSKARITINFGVSYGSDIEKARDLAVEATKANKRCSKTPDVACLLDGFGDSSVDFVLYFWIENVNDGFRNVKSEVLFSIWKSFKENGIEIPFPQRDLNIKQPANIQVTNNA